MKDFFKNILTFALFVLSVTGFYHLTYEIFLWRGTSHQASWILHALDKVHLEKFDPNIFELNSEIQPLSGPEREKTLEALKVDINEASLEELIGLPRVGPAIAQRIIEARSRWGPFSKLEDLGRVKGLGPKSLEILKNWVKFGPPKGSS